MHSHYTDRLEAAIRKKHTPAVVGIDPVIERFPAAFSPAEASFAACADALERFSYAVIETVAPLVPAIKINSGFFERYHERGVAAYYRAIEHAHKHDLLVIGDIKRGDIGSTAQFYARGHIDVTNCDLGKSGRIPDAVTLAGYLGENAVRPFIEFAREQGRGVYILVRPSDPGADRVHEFGERTRFYEHMAALVGEWGSAADLRGECGLSCVGAVVAPKDAESTSALRRAMPNTPFLVPGYGAQGGTADACRACFNADGRGAVVNSSRSVIYAHTRPEIVERAGSDWRACVREACEQFARDIAACCATA